MSVPPAPAVASALPLGFTVALNHRVRVRENGRVLIGGSPTRVLYLTEAAQRLFVGRRLAVSSAASRTLVNRLLDAAMAEPIEETLPEFGDDDFTWVVPVRDRPAALERLLQSLGHGHPVVVVDDDSKEPAAVEEVARGFGARYLHLDVNVGPGGARNAGLAVVETRFVGFVDSDIVIEPGAAEILLKHFVDDHVALACPRVLALPEPGGTGWIALYEEARSSLDLGRRPATVRPRSEVSWVPSACLVARVAAIDGGRGRDSGLGTGRGTETDGADSTAGFAAGLRVGEDVDLVWRLAEAGWRVRYEPAATVRHEHRTELGDWMLRKAVYGTGSLELGRRHPHDIAPVILAPWSAALVAAVLAQRRWSLPVAAGLFVYAAVGIRRKLGSSSHPTRLAITLTAQGTSAALSQGMALLLRHWWPLTLVGCLFSKRLRRAAVVAGVVDAAIEWVRTDARLDPLRFALARRLDDLAYGGGVWLSAIRGRSARALLPDIRRKR
ncbi:mycofactocin biosynthesis glycosyltransferase MftF [Subtercola endophyticus]|uniref:mycofactocin biosynthesis glycosyltransferase MftF n=1 Tax=Subtercola endophyticus TaxID=2895559 RepID=UPI001E343869|nr:mycofactocin biosynthesis glycosyltransferase MftF [Subtercola endophyticus]UFS58310.1 mycofactocin biosynthesis glycosyltransferase MftF [Subtercola endophyticus]